MKLLKKWLLNPLPIALVGGMLAGWMLVQQAGITSSEAQGPPGKPGLRKIPASPAPPPQHEVLYTSQNLSGHSVFAECNPGGGTSCPCSPQDASIASFEGYGEVTSNPRQVNTWVNAIGYRKFIEEFPNGTPIRLGKYKYVGKVRLPVLPAPNVNQRENAQAVHTMIQLWDGRSALFENNKFSIEAAIYWELNPWDPNRGKIRVYTGRKTPSEKLVLMDTGITLPPDTNWHTFELVVDLGSQRYVSVTIDGQTKDLSDVAMAQVSHPEWGSDVSLSITTESMATWPQQNCVSIFTWTTQFKDLVFGWWPQ